MNVLFSKENDPPAQAPDVLPFSVEVVLKGKRKACKEDGNTRQTKRNTMIIMFLFVSVWTCNCPSFADAVVPLPCFLTPSFYDSSLSFY